MRKTISPLLTLKQSWWLFASAIAALLPLVAYLPTWLTGSVVVGMAWRAWLIWHAGRLPPRWLMVIFVIAACVAVWLSYHSLFGRNPGLALLVVFLALKLLELRSVRDGLTIILLSCFLLLTSFFFSQSIPAAVMVIAALCVVIGAQLSLSTSAVKKPFQHIRQAALMLVQAVPFMLILFVLFPRVQGPLWGLPLDAFTASSGLTDQMSPGSFSQLVRSDAIVFRVHFKDKPPPNAQLYWRGLTMSQFDGRSWRRENYLENNRLPYKPAGSAIDYDVTLEPHNQRWLFALEQAGAIPNDTSFSSDHLLLAAQPVRARLRYSMQSYPDLKIGADESPRILRNALQLPDGNNPRTRAAAAEWKVQAGDNDETTLKLSMGFFQRQLLIYTLTPPLMGQDSVDEFLFDYKRGFCEHFASSFVFAMRAAGVPARVVGGYQGGEINPVDGFFIVRQSDAHAWAEVWLKQRGWVRVDPTAESAPSRIEGGLVNAVPSSDPLPLLTRGDLSWLRELRYRWEATANTWNQVVLGFNPERQRELLMGLGMPAPDWQQMTAWLATLSGLMLAAMTALVLYQRGKRDPVLRLWQQFRRNLARAGIVSTPWEGPATLAEKAAAKIPQHSAAIQEITALYSALRYGQNPNESELIARLQARVNHFRP